MNSSEDAYPHPLLPAVIALDENRVITHWSHGAESLFGLPRELAVGQAADQLEGWHVDPTTLQSYCEIPVGSTRAYLNQVVTRRGVHLTMNSVASASGDGVGPREILIRFSLSPGVNSRLDPTARRRSEPAAAQHHHLPSARRIMSLLRSHT